MRIPDLDVDVPLIPLDLDAAGALRPPASADRDLAGWYAAGTSPGETGTAIVTAHVDTPTGPAAFFRLAALAPGRQVAVDRRDGHTAIFTVDAVENHPKNDFPDDRVYRAAPRPELRLITCGGPYDPRRGGYRDNTVVYAHLTAIA